jgi:type II secretory pathway predicted ATPase ExeA
VWLDHWKIARDPFLDPKSPFVPTPTHAEAVARLVHAIETGQRLAVLRAVEGLGKSRVLAQAIEESRDPTRRVGRVVSPPDGAAMLTGLSAALGARSPDSRTRGSAWRTLADSVRLCRCQRLQVVLAVDGCEGLSAPADRLDLERLVDLDPHPNARVTVLRTTRTVADADATPDWGLAIRLVALTRGESHAYLAAKLAAAGREEPTFTPRAVNRLHLLSGGSPRGLDRLASLALMAAALRGLEIVPPEVVEGAVRELTPAEAWGESA